VPSKIQLNYHHSAVLFARPGQEVPIYDSEEPENGFVVVCDTFDISTAIFKAKIETRESPEGLVVAYCDLAKMTELNDMSEAVDLSRFDNTIAEGRIIISHFSEVFSPN